MIGKAMITAVFAIFLAATVAFAFGGGGVGGAPGVGAPMETLMPSPPRNVAATAGAGMATVSFKPPRTNGGNPITVYTVTSHPGRLIVRGTKSPIVVRGLNKGETYTFTVTASNSVGTGLDSNPSNCVTP